MSNLSILCKLAQHGEKLLSENFPFIKYFSITLLSQISIIAKENQLSTILCLEIQRTLFYAGHTLIKSNGKVACIHNFKPMIKPNVEFFHPEQHFGTELLARAHRSINSGNLSPP